MLAKLVPVCDALILTSSQNPRALPPPTLQSLAGQLGCTNAESVRDPLPALARARELAGPDGVVLATGSIYLVADLLAARGGAPRGAVPRCCERRRRLPAEPPEDDRARRAQRGDRDPRVLRDRLPVRSGVPVSGLLRTPGQPVTKLDAQMIYLANDFRDQEQHAQPRRRAGPAVSWRSSGWR